MSAPTWIPLARGARAAPLEGLIAAWKSAEPPLAVRADEDGNGVWIEYPIEAEAWHRAEGSPAGELEEWWTARPTTAGFGNLDGERLELLVGGRSIPRHLRHLAREHDDASAGEYCLVLDDRIVLERPAEDGAPAAGLLDSWLERGHEESGVWRAAIARIASDGLTVWPGESLVLTCDVPPASALRLVTASRNLGRPGELRFRVRLDGEVLLDHAQPNDPGTETAHVLRLPPAGERGARLTFEVQGPPAISAFLEPVIGPVEVGNYGARPWTPERPDVVLFLADTFRADNLAAYGGDPAVCPQLDRLGERGVRFLQARSASVWTLPSHGALFSGLYPPQHGAVERGLTLSDGIDTLAEELARAGYRTGAVTDSGFVSRHFGFDQGFGWFQEQDNEKRKLSNTLAWADDFLARDDGRPVFLFVHTYRTHSPYRQGPDESDVELKAFVKRVREETGAPLGKKLDPRLVPYLPEYLALYRGGAHGLDALFGPWFDSLERRGLFRDGFLVFTSDHGEAFFEHGTREHDGRPHEEKVRIPLFLFGTGVAPRDVSFGASLVDVAPTIGALAGLPPHAGWIGTPLLQLDRERLLFSYNQDERGVYLAAIEGDRKLIETVEPGERPRGSFDEAYSLSADPLERENLAARKPSWVRELTTRSVAELEAFFHHAVEPTPVDLPEDARASLHALGYGE